MLVGGEGTRLRPLTLTTPKQMLPVVEVVMIERVLAHLAGHGVDRAVLSMGYRPDAFLAAFPDDRCAGVALDYAVEPAPLDTGGAIRFAALHAGVGETFLVVNGDVLTDLDVSALIAFHRRRGAEATIHLSPVDNPSAFGVVPTDDAGRVLAFIEKPPGDRAPTNFINAGTYVVEPALLDRIPEGRRISIERETFPALVDDGSLFALPTKDYWIDAGTVAAYLKANHDLLSGARGRSPAPGARSAGNGAWTLGGPVIHGTVAASSLVGDAAFVSRGSRVDRSVVGAGARVEEAKVVDSVLLPGAVVRPGALVEGSIVGAGAVVGKEAAVCRLSVIGDRRVVEAGTRMHGARLPESR